MAFLHPSQDPQNLLIGPHSASLRALFSGVMIVHPRRDSSTRGPTTLTSDSWLSTFSTGSANLLISLMRLIHERIFLENFFRVRRKPLT